jgi:prolipoprotein diacylglyceryltransferase
MVTINLDPTLFHMGPLAFSWYGLAVAAGMLVGI